MFPRDGHLCCSLHTSPDFAAPPAVETGSWSPLPRARVSRWLQEQPPASPSTLGERVTARLPACAISPGSFSSEVPSCFNLRDKSCKLENLECFCTLSLFSQMSPCMMVCVSTNGSFQLECPLRSSAPRISTLIGLDTEGVRVSKDGRCAQETLWQLELPFQRAICSFLQALEGVFAHPKLWTTDLNLTLSNAGISASSKTPNR